MKQFIEDFKSFALRGNVLDLAVGVVIGGAFSKIVSSLVEDIITPLISTVLNTSEMASWTMVIGSSNGEDVLLKYGSFIQNIIDFVLIAFCIFVAIRIIGKFTRKEKQEATPAKSAEIVILEEIRDAIKSK